jgi:hypothetical protein
VVQLCGSRDFARAESAMPPMPMHDADPVEVSVPAPPFMAIRGRMVMRSRVLLVRTRTAGRCAVPSVRRLGVPAMRTLVRGGVLFFRVRVLRRECRCGSQTEAQQQGSEHGGSTAGGPRKQAEKGGVETQSTESSSPRLSEPADGRSGNATLSSPEYRKKQGKSAMRSDPAAHPDAIPWESRLHQPVCRKVAKS